MKDELLNGELVISYPEGFEVWDDAKMQEAYGSPQEDRWTIQEEKTGIIVEVLWKQLTGVAGMMARSATMIARGDEINMQKALEDKNYVLKGFDTAKPRKISFANYYFEYDQNGLRQIGRIACFSRRGTVYKVFCLSDDKVEKDADAVFAMILADLEFC